MRINPDIIQFEDGKNVNPHVFEEFLLEYQPMLNKVEDYLDTIIEKTDSIYREAYIPWKKALHEIVRGVYLLARKIPIPSKEELTEALFMFSFKGAIMFLQDICSICQIALKRDWEQDFQVKINQLLFLLSSQNQQKQMAR